MPVTPSRIGPRLLVALAVLVAVGAVVLDVASALILAALVLLVVCIDPKPAFRAWFDAPGDADSGRSGWRFFSWRRDDPSPRRPPPPRE